MNKITEMSQNLTNSVSAENKPFSLRRTLFGLVVVIVSGVLLSWNEGQYVKNLKLADELVAKVLSVGVNEILPENDRRLIYVSGNVKANETLNDGLVMVDNALVLFRKVEMYQWIEQVNEDKKSSEQGKGENLISYSYDKQWKDRPIDSSKYGDMINYQNPVNMPVNNIEMYAKSSYLGSFKLSKQHLSKLNPRPYHLSHEVMGYTLFEDAYYSGNPKVPEVGDYRIKYEYVPLVSISVLGLQYDNTIAAYVSDNGEALFVKEGKVSANDIIGNFNEKSSFLVWLFRAIGVVLMIFGFNFVLAPVLRFIAKLPVIGSMLSSVGSGFLSVAGFFVALFIIASSWALYRPTVAWSLWIFAGFVVFLYVYKKIKKK